jgi:hypothetical protein
VVPSVGSGMLLAPANLGSLAMSERPESLRLPRLPDELRGPARKFHEYASTELDRRRTSGEEFDEKRFVKAVTLVLRRLGVTREDLQ